MMVEGRIIFLVGFSGAGKSTVGPQLAGELGVRFIDTDSLIEQLNKMTIPQIFRTQGERGFRRLERTVLERTIAAVRGTAVMALGGGAVISGGNRRLLKDHGITVYLSCSTREIYRRLRNDNVDRPLLQVRPRPGERPAEARQRRIAELLAGRRRYYRQSDLTVSTSNKAVDAIVNEIKRKVRRFADRDQSTT